MNIRITDLLDDYMDDTIPMAPLPVPKNRGIKEATMKRIKKQNYRPLRMVLIAAVIAVLMTGTVLGVYAGRHWAESIVTYFQVADNQKAMLDSALYDVNVSTESNGCTFSITQILGDEHCILIAMDIKLPDTVPLDTISWQELKQLAEKNGYPWLDDNSSAPGVIATLTERYGYGEDMDEYSDAPHLGFLTGYPIEISGEELLSRIGKELEGYSSEDQELLWSGTCGKILCEKAEENTGPTDSFHGSGILKREFSPETRTLSILFYMHSNQTMQGQRCTIILKNLWLENIRNTYSSPAEKRLFDKFDTDLLYEPLVLNFTANYTPQSKDYNIYENGKKIGTVELSQFSAVFTFPTETDNAEYSSLEEAAMVPNRRDYIGHLPNVSVKMNDGTLIPLQEHSGGIGSEQTGFFISDTPIDLTQVETLLMQNYTFALQE